MSKMYHIPLRPVQKRCLDTYMREKQLPNFPVKQISQVMRNKGLFLGLYPETVSDIIHAIHQEGCITYWMFRSYIATNYYYQLSLCLRHEAELYRWVWLGHGGEILKKSDKTFKNEEACLSAGYIKVPHHCHVCIESEAEPNRCPIILV